jgi:hypothetical protein
MLRRLSILFVVALLTTQFAQGQEVACAPACESACCEQSEALFFDGAISTHFDNAEHSGNNIGYSRTIFAVRLTPTLGYRFGKAGLL